MTNGSSASPQAAGLRVSPRRRLRTDDDVGFLGDAPILLALPSLCGVPDTEDAPTQEAPTEQAPTQEAPTQEALSEQAPTQEASDHDPSDNGRLISDSASASATDSEAAAADSEAAAAELRDDGVGSSHPSGANEAPADTADGPRTEPSLDAAARDGQGSDGPGSQAPTDDGEPMSLRERLLARRQTAGGSRLRRVAPQFVTSSAVDPLAEAPDQAPDADATDANATDADEPELAQTAARRSTVHRKIILWTALFVAVSSVYLYVNRKRPGNAPPVSGEVAPLPEIDLAWDETPEPYTEVTPPVVESPELDGPSLGFSDAAADQTTPMRLPELNEAASAEELQFTRLRSRSEQVEHPRTNSPDANWNVSQAPDGLRTSMAPPSAESSLEGVQPLTPHGGAHEQRY